MEERVNENLMSKGRGHISFEVMPKGPGGPLRVKNRSIPKGGIRAKLNIGNIES